MCVRECFLFHDLVSLIIDPHLLPMHMEVYNNYIIATNHKLKLRLLHIIKHPIIIDHVVCAGGYTATFEQWIF